MPHGTHLAPLHQPCNLYYIDLMQCLMLTTAELPRHHAAADCLHGMAGLVNQLTAEVGMLRHQLVIASTQTGATTLHAASAAPMQAAVGAPGNFAYAPFALPMALPPQQLPMPKVSMSMTLFRAATCWTAAGLDSELCKVQFSYRWQTIKLAACLLLHDLYLDNLTGWCHVSITAEGMPVTACLVPPVDHTDAHAVASRVHQVFF